MQYSIKFNTKWIGITIIILSIILMYILAISSFKIASSEAVACVHPVGAQCPITAHIPLASYLGFILLLVIGALGLHLAIKSNVAEAMRKEVAEKAEAVVKGLKGDEKHAYEKIMNSQGAIFQSELVDRMGYSKVKISRILDKLEGKNLIERRRRGLTNMILIKYK